MAASGSSPGTCAVGSPTWIATHLSALHEEFQGGGPEPDRTPDVNARQVALGDLGVDGAEANTESCGGLFAGEEIVLFHNAAT